MELDDTRLAKIRAIIDGVSVPWMKGAKKPVLRQTKEPKEDSGGKPNPMWFVDVRDTWIDFNTEWFNYYGHLHPKTTEMLKTIDDMAKRSGVDLTSFSPEVFSLTDIESVNRVLEATVEELEEITGRIEKSSELAFKMIDDAKKKSMVVMLRKIIQTQKLCRDEVPDDIAKRYRFHPQERKWLDSWKYSHTIRYMLYTMRSTLTTTGGREAPCEAPAHLVKAAMMISMSRAARVTHGIKGVLIRIPPRHGKTQLATCDRALRHCIAPYQPVFVIHNTKDNASERLEMVRNHFDNRTSVGRRRNALFPGFTLTKKTRDSSEKMVLLLNDAPACMHVEGNLAARGVHSKVQGVTAYELLFDDPTDEKEKHEEGTRERTNAALDQTWMSRLTGAESFFVYICTAWHPDDFSAQLVKQSRQGHIQLAYYGQAAGGPEEGFKPIWPEGGYDSDFLASRYYTLGPDMYACIYQNNPDTESARKIKRLHFYDYRYYLDSDFDGPDAESWKRFLASRETTFFISTDPAGSASKYSNLAGITYAAFGAFRYKHPSNPNMEISIPRIAFLDFWSGTASQHDLADKIEEWTKDRRVDKIVIETTGGYHATAEELVRNRNIESEKVIQRPPSGTNKLRRLSQYAIHIERGDAVFPGEPDVDESESPTLSLMSGWQDMAEQLLRAGSTADSCLTDCVSQQLAEVSYDIHDMTGETSLVRPQRAVPDMYVDAKQRAFRQLKNPKPVVEPGRGYAKFLKGHIN